LQIIFVLVEVGVERTVAWPAEVFDVLVIPQQVIVMLFQNRLVVVELHRSAGTLRALKVNSILVGPNCPVIEAVNNLLLALDNRRLGSKSHGDWLKEMSQVDAESVFGDPIVKFESDSRLEFVHGKRQFVVKHPRKVEFRVPSRILLALERQGRKEVCRNFVVVIVVLLVVILVHVAHCPGLITAHAPFIVAVVTFKPAPFARHRLNSWLQDLKISGNYLLFDNVGLSSCGYLHERKQK
jgi:hypothetical protein